MITFWLVVRNNSIQIIEILIHFITYCDLVPIRILLEGINDSFVEFVGSLIRVVEEWEGHNFLFFGIRLLLLS